MFWNPTIFWHLLSKSGEFLKKNPEFGPNFPKKYYVPIVKFCQNKNADCCFLAQTNN
jgi:hypothetical protein